MQRSFHIVQWLSNVSSWPVLFKEQGSIKVWSCLWKWIMSRKRLRRTLEKELMLIIRLEKATKPSLMSLDSTNPQSNGEIQERRYLPEKWSTNKGHSKAECVMVCEVEKVPSVSSKQLKASLTLANCNVHEPTIRRTLSNGVHELREESH